MLYSWYGAFIKLDTYSYFVSQITVFGIGMKTFIYYIFLLKFSYSNHWAHILSETIRFEHIRLVFNVFHVED